METQSNEWMDEADFFTVQDWPAYSTVDHDVWRTLYERRLHELEETGSRIFLSGCEAIGLGPDRVPELRDVNGRLEKRTGWRSVPVSGFIPGADFFRCLAHRRFPTTVTVRPPDRLDYVPEPDIFHDVFGHVPLHADSVFADFLQRFGQAAVLARNEKEAEGMGRLFWFTVEFGLIRE